MTIDARTPPANAVKAALYARYSTEGQSEASIDDQFHTVQRVADREGFTVVARYGDEAISGGTADRPGYQAMLTAARAREFTVIVCEDVSRLWRNRAEFGPRSAELQDLGVQMVTAVGDDTRREGWGLTIQLKQMIAESQRLEGGYRTKRGLEGRARAQKSPGGRAYGYLSEKDSPTKERMIHAKHAAIVREVFERFGAGETLRAIATDLNGRGIPSPGAEWKRKTRPTDGLWRLSALHAILHNEMYLGRLIWNRTRWVRSAANSKMRRCVANPPDQWIVHERPDLAIIERELWERVQARLTHRAAVFRRGAGGAIKYPLSGLMRCGVCDGAFTVSAHNPVRYACSTRHAAGDDACSNGLKVRREVAEDRIFEAVKQTMASPIAVEHAVKSMEQMATTDQQAISAPAPALGTLDKQIVEIERLRSAGILSEEVAGAALAQARAQRASAVRPKPRPVPALDGAAEAYLTVTREFRSAVAGENVPATREALKGLLAPIRLHPRDGKLVAELTAGPVVLAFGLGTIEKWFGSGGRI